MSREKKEPKKSAKNKPKNKAKKKLEATLVDKEQPTSQCASSHLSSQPRRPKGRPRVSKKKWDIKFVITP